MFALEFRSESALRRFEIFGPVTILERFIGLNEAFSAVNDTGPVMAAAIFTSSLTTAFHAVDKLRVGAVIVSDIIDFRIDAIPFGGPSPSGLGREGVPHAALAMSEPRLAIFSI